MYLQIKNKSVYFNHMTSHYCVPDFLVNSLHKFWQRGIDADLCSNDIANRKIQANTYWTDKNEFDFNNDTYLGDSVWCFPPYTRGDSDRFLKYIVRARGNKQFKEALVLIPTSINGTKPIDVINADELFYSKQVNGYNYKGNVGHYLAYFTTDENRSNTLELLLHEYFWRAPK